MNEILGFVIICYDYEPVLSMWPECWIIYKRPTHTAEKVAFIQLDGERIDEE